MTRLIAMISMVAFLAACGAVRDSKFNPFNWFKPAVETLEVAEDAVDPRGLVDQVASLKIDRLPGGAIIHAVGLPQTQGFFDGELVPLNGEFPDKGALVYEFRVIPPLQPEPAGVKRSREILVGYFVSDQTLIGVRRIVVIGLNNRRSARR